MSRGEASFAFVPPLLLPDSITSLFLAADKYVLSSAENSKLLRLLRRILTTVFLFVPSRHLSSEDNDLLGLPANDIRASLFRGARSGDSGIARALSQLLSMVNTIPVSSRKYEVVRCLAEELIDENYSQGHEALLEVNRTVLSAAFARTLSQFEAALEERGFDVSSYGECSWSRPVLKACRLVWSRVGRMRKGKKFPSESSAEKLVAELLWLAQKMAACGCADEAVLRWASASSLARLSLNVEPRLQSSLVKISAFLFKQARDVSEGKSGARKNEQRRHMKMNMLMSWLPLLCRGSNGTDAPVLSLSEKAELEKILDETIAVLDLEDEQEGVLSLWLHHFMYCPSSDWPNLQSSYVRWFSSSCRLLVKYDKL